MTTQHIGSLILSALAAACELGATFGKGDVAGLQLLPAGILLWICAWALCHTHHNANVG